MKLIIIPLLLMAMCLCLGANAEQLTECELVALLREAGFEEQDLAQLVCTANKESNRDCKAVNDKLNPNGSIDYGLFQINDRFWCTGSKSASKEHNDCNVKCKDLYDCKKNVACAKIIFGVHKLKAWYGYLNNKIDCDRYELPVECRDPPVDRSNEKVGALSALRKTIKKKLSPSSFLNDYSDSDMSTSEDYSDETDDGYY